MPQSLQDVLDQLTGLRSTLGDLDLFQLAFLLLVSLVSSLVVSWMYLVFYDARDTGSRIHRAFPLLGLSITTIFVSIQFSLPLSLGLLGALSIVRFRTPIKEPEEIGFILLVISASLAVATFNLGLLLLLLCVALLALAIQRATRLFRRRSGGGTVVVSLPGDEFEAVRGKVLEVLGGALTTGRLESLAEEPDGARLSYRFGARDASRALTLRPDVEKVAAGSRVAVFFEQSNA